MAGYAVECALKACIAKSTKRYEFPDLAKTRDVYTHDLEKLVKLSGLSPELKTLQRSDTSFEVNWAIVKDWSEQARYQVSSVAQATAMYDVIANKRHGVLRWIRQYW